VRDSRLYAMGENNMNESIPLLKEAAEQGFLWHEMS